MQIIENYGCHKIIAQSVVASILQWNRTKVIDENTLNAFLSAANSNSKFILILYFIMMWNTTHILKFSVIVSAYQSRLCKNNHKLFSFLTTGSILITYSLTR